jgi:glycosyltransferase involved in cell wall biosynthesis
MKVSIITVCRNSEKTIERTILSVLNQTYQDIEYIIIDGKSTDNTLKIVGKYKNSIKLISEKDNGIYDAMNKGIKMAEGDIIGILNSDDWYEKDAIEKVVKKYDKEYGKYQVIYGGVKIWKDDKMVKLCWNSAENLQNDCIQHPAMFVTRETYRVFGTFLTKYKLAADYELQLRYWNSEKVLFVPIYDMITNFSLGGASSADVEVAIECNDIKYKYGNITQLTYIKRKIIFKMQKIWHSLERGISKCAK